ncbi:MAG: D-alanyl-D-alanine carboxypeptidase [Lachnospiraceae bacterium]|nr:D-alanyl-D-alanine carboxypeptidase [Lachnospiraceae bacterium]
MQSLYQYESEEERLERENEQKRLERRRQKRAEMRRKRRRQVMINRCILGTVCICILVGFIFLIRFSVKGISKLVKENDTETELQGSDDTDLQFNSTEPVIELEEVEPEEIPVKTYEAHTTDATVITGADVISERSVMIDLATGDILMQKGYKDRISPASMTKVLTVLVAAEHLTEEQLDDTFTITPEITSYVWKHDCSAVCWSDDEVVTVRDLLYGTILPSGADAAVGLATYIAGSQEAFVDMMNEKIDELGLSGSSHFTNCVGLYDDNHYSTVYDIAMMMEAAVDNDLALKALSTKKYVTTSTAQHPDGIEISNWFLRRIEDKDTGGEVIAAKTGFVNESRNCAVSYGKDNSGNDYVICTQGSTSSWRCIYDHVAMYKQFEGKINNGSQDSSAVITEDETEGEAPNGN